MVVVRVEGVSQRPASFREATSGPSVELPPLRFALHSACTVHGGPFLLQEAEAERGGARRAVAAAGHPGLGWPADGGAAGRSDQDG